MNTEKVLLNAKTLRANQTEAEQRLWHHLRAHRYHGFEIQAAKTHGTLYRDFGLWNGC
jgi:very-short-patch-repair endonuclease